MTPEELEKYFPWPGHSVASVVGTRPQPLAVELCSECGAAVSVELLSKHIDFHKRMNHVEALTIYDDSEAGSSH